jgi:aspartyl-tRNA(Asn)/glutamyl-tRNA(Gln) amidotransferase subunit B
MMRTKEDAHDYRYFPDPDLLPLVISADWIARTRAAMPELPEAKMRDALSTITGFLPTMPAALTSSLEMADFFESTVTSIAGKANAKPCANWVMVDLAARLNKEGKELGRLAGGAAQLGGLVAAHRRWHHLQQHCQEGIRGAVERRRQRLPTRSSKARG